MSIWWADAANQPLTLVTPDDEWSDDYGSTVPDGEFGIWLNVDNDAGAIMCGSLEDLADELTRALGLVRAALEETAPVEVPTVFTPVDGETVKTIYTDDYGTVTEELHEILKDKGFSPMDFEELCDEVGSRWAWARLVEAAKRGARP